jgi:regulatory factor X
MLFPNFGYRLEGACVPAKTSVPRGRVYATYAARCGDERVQPLNPASFGKLVRVIFAGITTRRLGVRGESKYHYVDLALVDDPEEDRLRRSLMQELGDAPMRPQSVKSASIDLG